VSFSIISNILLLNLLIALMNSTFEDVSSESSQIWVRQWAQYILRAERRLLPRTREKLRAGDYYNHHYYKEKKFQKEKEKYFAFEVRCSKGYTSSERVACAAAIVCSFPHAHIDEHRLGLKVFPSRLGPHLIKKFMFAGGGPQSAMRRAEHGRHIHCFECRVSLAGSVCPGNAQAASL
jgi:hypothetical protein